MLVHELAMPRAVDTILLVKIAGVLARRKG
jgi:hypothetical protein